MQRYHQGDPGAAPVRARADEKLRSLRVPRAQAFLHVLQSHAGTRVGAQANAVAYLLKPVVEERLRTVVSRIMQLVTAPGEAAGEAARARGVAGAIPKPLHHLLAVQRDRYLLIPLSEACFFEVEDGVTYLKTATASFRTNYAIGDLESRLPSPPFFRAHRSTIANLDQVATLSPMFKGSLMLTMKDSKASEIQVSERQAKRVRELLQL